MGVQAEETASAEALQTVGTRPGCRKWGSGEKRHRDLLGKRMWKALKIPVGNLELCFGWAVFVDEQGTYMICVTLEKASRDCCVACRARKEAVRTVRRPRKGERC